MKNGIYIDKYGNKFYYYNDKFHREDGPAIEHIKGKKVWYMNGKIHREDGPAIEWSNGDIEWYINSECICGGIK